MKKIIKALWEHLITKRKYNTLKLKLNVVREDNERLITQMNTEKRIHLKRQQIWEEKLKEQEEKIIELKNKLKRKKEK